MEFGTIGFGHHSGFLWSGSSKLEITNTVWVASQFLRAHALKDLKSIIDQHVDPSPQGHGSGRRGVPGVD